MIDGTHPSDSGFDKFYFIINWIIYSNRGAGEVGLVNVLPNSDGDFLYLFSVRTWIRVRANRCTTFSIPTSNYKSQCNQRKS